MPEIDTDNSQPQHVCTERERLVKIDMTLNHLSNQFHDFSVTLFGNGKPGVKTDVDRLKVAHEQERNIRERQNNWRDKVTATIAGGVLLSLAAQVFNFFHKG